MPSTLMWLSEAQDMCTPSADVKHNLERILEHRERYYHDHANSLSPLEATPGTTLSYEEGSNTSALLQDSLLFAHNSSCSCTPRPHRPLRDADVGLFTASALPTFMQTPSHNTLPTSLVCRATIPEATHSEPSTPRVASPPRRQSGATHSARTSPRTMPVPLRQRDPNTPSPCPPRCPPGQAPPQPGSRPADDSAVCKDEIAAEADMHALDNFYQRQLAQLQQMVQKIDRERAAAVVKAQQLLDVVEELRLQSLVKEKEGDSLRSALLQCSDEVQRLQYEYDWLCRLYQHDQRFYQVDQQGAVLREEELARRVNEAGEARWRLSMQLHWCQTRLLAPQSGVPIVAPAHAAPNTRLHDVTTRSSRGAGDTAALSHYAPPSITRGGGAARCYVSDNDSFLHPAAPTRELPVSSHYDRPDVDMAGGHPRVTHQTTATAVEAVRVRSSPRRADSQRAMSTPVLIGEMDGRDTSDLLTATSEPRRRALQERCDALARELAEERLLTADMQNEIDDLVRSELVMQEQSQRCELQAECDAAESCIVWELVRWQATAMKRGAAVRHDDTSRPHTGRAVGGEKEVSSNVNGYDGDDIVAVGRQGAATLDPRCVNLVRATRMEERADGAASAHTRSRPPPSYEEMLGALGTVVEQVVRAQLLPLKLSTESTRALLEDARRDKTGAVSLPDTTLDTAPCYLRASSASSPDAAVSEALPGWPHGALTRLQGAFERELDKLRGTVREGVDQILVTQGTLQDTLAAVHGVARRAARVAAHNQKALDARLVDILACQSSLARQSVLTAASMSCSSVSAHRPSSRWTSCETTRMNDSAVIDVSALALGAVADDVVTAAGASMAARLPTSTNAPQASPDQSCGDTVRRVLMCSSTVPAIQKAAARSTAGMTNIDTARPLPLHDEGTTLSSSRAWCELLDEVSDATQATTHTPYDVAESDTIE